MKQITALILTAVVVGIIVITQEFYSPVEEKVYDYSATEFIEPSNTFTFCYVDDDCFKFKGSACPADSGGIEVCVHKNYIQEYNSVIEDAAGKQWERGCPEIYLVSEKMCSCIDSKCTLM
ncbi:MAG: hypothetical protein ABIE55_02345 [Candidatus Aenigmatarchaeota archaeon]